MPDPPHSHRGLLTAPEAFAADPRGVWEWYTWRRDLVASCEPNPAHRALAAAVRGGRLAIVTQNVDGLHRDAFNGPFDPGGLVELHGSLFATRCLDCGRRNDERGAAKLQNASGLPVCGCCGGFLRPDVVWFGEPLDPARWRQAVQLAESADVCLVVGTSAVVQPAASLGGVTVRAGGVIIEVNIAATALSGQAELSLIGPASEVVPAILGVGDAHGVPHDA